MPNRFLMPNITPIYLDCNATTPMEPEVRAEMMRIFEEEIGNDGSRTHEFGVQAKRLVQKARDQVAFVAGVQRDEVIFTSGATESNNISILGLAAVGEETGRRHIISTQIEHKAVLEPLEALKQRGFEIELVPPETDGSIDPQLIKNALRRDTLLVSVMHANNETGVVQPIEQIGEVLQLHSAYFHVDAAQTFGKVIAPLRNPRVDLISLSAHKIYGPKGVGALITRRRGFDRPPLRPLFFGGGQERGLRPGTLPVPLISALGAVCELAFRNYKKREARCREFRKELEGALFPLGAKINGNGDKSLTHVVNLSFERLDSEAVMVALKGFVAISNGSACTSSSYTPSHVLKAMGMSEERIMGSLRFSWCHMTPAVDWKGVVNQISSLQR